MNVNSGLFLLILIFLPFVVLADDEVSFKQLDEQAAAIKLDMLELGRDMVIFEDEILYPEQSRVAIYLSMDVGEFFDLQSVKLLLANNVIAQQDYSSTQSLSFEKGAVQRLYINNLNPGKYELTAYFEGKGPRHRTYKRALNYVLDKSNKPAYVEFRISDNVKRLQPEFMVREW